MKVSTKLYVALFMQFIVTISLVSILIYMQAKQKHDSLVINLAGRQRMLSQKMTKEILLFSEGQLSSEKVTNTINVFHATLNSLNHGGKAPLDLAQTQFAELPRPSSKISMAVYYCQNHYAQCPIYKRMTRQKKNKPESDKKRNGENNREP